MRVIHNAEHPTEWTQCPGCGHRSPVHVSAMDYYRRRHAANPQYVLHCFQCNQAAAPSAFAVER